MKIEKTTDKGIAARHNQSTGLQMQQDSDNTLVGGADISSPANQ